MRTKTMHMTVAGGNSTVGHQYGHLMQRLRMTGPKFVHSRRIRQVGARIFLLRVNEVGKLDAVVQKEHRGVIADDVVVTLTGVDFYRKAARIAREIAGILTSTHRREAYKNLGFFTFALQEISNCVFTQTLVKREVAISTGSARMHNPLWNPLAVKMRELFK